MTDGRDTSELAVMTFELLKRIQTQLDRVENDARDLRIHVAGVEASVAQQGVQMAALNARMDRFDERLTRIEKRLDLTDA